MSLRQFDNAECRRSGVIADRGYSATREQAMADFKAQWLTS
jgi:hypothetical protein